MRGYLKIDPADNVAVALEPLAEGSEVGGVLLKQDIPAGHKIALADMAEGDNVIKYGFPTGRVTKAVGEGTLVDHTCIRTNLEGIQDYQYTPSSSLPPSAPDEVDAVLRETFNGFRRASGEVGIRNQIWIIPTVGCVNAVSETIARRLSEEMVGNMGSVDAIVALPHSHGCSQLGDDHENTRRILADLVHHPNAGGVLIVALGCENNRLSSFMELVGDVDPCRVKTIELQKVEGDEVEAGLSLARSIFEVCRKDVRTSEPTGSLKVGLKCGGSDGLSGITANPLLGRFSDWLTARGGTTVLGEVPEMFGAETVLMNRCRDREIFEKTVRLINGYKKYLISNGQSVYENPSPGNKEGGISTLEEKSLGCVRKGGTGTVTDVVPYGGRISSSGLNLLETPGNDLVASTALAASGCQIVLFTTGRGTPYGCFVPTVKVSTNTPLARRKGGWIDFNAGVITDGKPMDSVLEEFLDTVFETVNGRPTRNEENCSRDMAIWKKGVTL